MRFEIILLRWARYKQLGVSRCSALFILHQRITVKINNNIFKIYNKQTYFILHNKYKINNKETIFFLSSNILFPNYYIAVNRKRYNMSNLYFVLTVIHLKRGLFWHLVLMVSQLIVFNEVPSSIFVLTVFCVFLCKKKKLNYFNFEDNLYYLTNFRFYTMNQLVNCLNWNACIAELYYRFPPT